MAKRLRHEATARIGFRILGGQAKAHQRQLRLRLGLRRAGPKARPNLDAGMRVAQPHYERCVLTDECKNVRLHVG